MIKLFLSPTGRISRKAFWIAFVVFAVFVTLAQFGLDKISESMWGFFLSLLFIFLFFQMLYAIHGKRLHDLGRSFWPLTAMTAGTMLAMIVVMMIYGGAEYFTEFSQYERKEDIDPVEIERIQAAYQDRLAGGTKVLGPLLWGAWGLFTLWVGLAKADSKPNKYGPPAE